MGRDTYQDFAERYDLTFGEFTKHEPSVIDFFSKLFTEKKVRTVLDCACGTGRHLHLFHSLGCEVFGSDLSESMLAQAEKNLAEHGIGNKARLSQADYRELHLLPLCQGLVALSLDGAVVDEDVRLALALNEPEALGIVEPFDGAGHPVCHESFPSPRPGDVVLALGP